MKFLKEYLIKSSKGSHKRSLTDHAGLDDGKKVKYCWSQQFDSELFSVVNSKKRNTTPSKIEISYDDGDEKEDESRVE